MMKNNKNNYLNLIGLLFALAGAVVSTLLVCKHIFPEVCSSSMGCTLESGVDGCRELGTSKHSKIFLGIPIALFGLFYYLFISMLFYRGFRGKDQEEKEGLTLLLFSLAIFGFIVDIALGYKNFLVLVYPCMLCAYTYLATAGIFVVSLLLFLDVKGESVAGLLKGIKSAVVPGALAVSSTVLILLLFFGISMNKDGEMPEAQAGVGGGEAPVYPLVSPDRMSSILSSFKALKSANLSEAGLINREGNSTAPIVIHKFADFRCGHCLEASHVLREALQRWPDHIKIYYRHFPLDGTCNPLVSRPQPGGWSCNGAQASLCSPEQGIFPSMYHGLFHFQETGQNLTPELIQELTESFGGKWEKMKSCMGSPKTTALLKRDIKDAEAIEVNSTPTIIVQNKILTPGTPNKVYFLYLLDSLVYEKFGEKAYEEYRLRNQKK